MSDETYRLRRLADVALRRYNDARARYPDDPGYWDGMGAEARHCRERLTTAVEKDREEQR